MPLFSDPSVGIAEPLLRHAYCAAERGRGGVSPNPLVGCVIARDGVPIAEGHHERAGGPHAEIVALALAGEQARGADVYVTLEPCNHHGRTPPCVDALLSAGVVSVTIGMPDSNIGVSGGGAGALAHAGVRVAWAADPRPFERQNEAWLHRLRTGRPFVRVKVALSLDGHAALAVGRRSRISGEGGSDVTMRLRADATAVAVGAGTVSIDDPRLTVRSADGDTVRTPRRYVLARTTLPGPGARLFVDPAQPTTVLIAAGGTEYGPDDSVPEAAMRVMTYPAADGLRGALEVMAADGVDDVLIEAGPRLLTALIESALVDELIVVTAGGLAGAGAPAVFQAAAQSQGDDLAPAFVPVEVGIAGDDAVTVWRPMHVVAAERGKGSAS